MAHAGASPHWERMWAAGLQPGQAFDNGVASPALVHVLSRKLALQSAPPGARPGGDLAALVPGGGRGYDALALLAEFPGAQVTTLDLSASCCEEACKWLGQQPALEKVTGTADDDESAAAAAASCCLPLPSLAAASAGANGTGGVQGGEKVVGRFRLAGAACATGPGTLSVVCDSFFDFPVPRTFDLVWDCTFLCALAPEARRRWAERYRELVTPQTGELWTLIFPMHEGGEARNLATEPGSGPPFELNLALVEGLLKPLGFECARTLDSSEVPIHIGRLAKGARNMVCCWVLRS